VSFVGLRLIWRRFLVRHDRLIVRSRGGRRCRTGGRG